MTQQIQILQRRLECFSRDLKVLCIAWKVFLMYLGGNRRRVALKKYRSFYRERPKQTWEVAMLISCDHAPDMSLPKDCLLSPSGPATSLKNGKFPKKKIRVYSQQESNL